MFEGKEYVEENFNGAFLLETEFVEDFEEEVDDDDEDDPSFLT